MAIGRGFGHTIEGPVKTCSIDFYWFYKIGGGVCHLASRDIQYSSGHRWRVEPITIKSLIIYFSILLPQLFHLRSNTEEINLRVESGSKKIHQLLQETFECVQISKSSPQWTEYTSYVNSIVVEGLKKSILLSLRTMYNKIVSKNLQVPICSSPRRPGKWV